VTGLGALELRLGAWARSLHGAGAKVRDVSVLPGNAGLSYSFVLEPGDAAPTRLVLRLAAPGVPERGPNDVLRQVPLLRALEAARVPVAPLVWSTDDPAHFGSSALIVGFVDGRPLHMTDRRLAVAVEPERAPLLVAAAVDVLAAVHRVDGRARLAGWASPVAPERELERWRSVFERVARADRGGPEGLVHDALRASLPARCASGLMHGDFQTNNVLFRDDAVVAVLDWELAGIGPQLLDLAWLTIFNDRDCWSGDYRSDMWATVAPGAIAARYADAIGHEVETDLPWFTALACYRFAAIIAFNLQLHRDGKRVDAVWERLAGSRATLLARTGDLL
jgi:aminoglycoside phosphotransferase (APT) family kinase protein